MVSKVLNVFYGNDYLPYKDSERTVHFPIGGGTFAGSQNTFKIRFYVKDIGGASGITWVLVSKLPNGKLGYELLNAIGTDEVLGEQYVETYLSSYYTQYKGVVKLALRGYQGEVSFVEDEDTGTYSVVGTPIIGVTGTIDIAINYSPMVYGEQLLPSELDRILAALDECVKNGSVIIRVASLDDIDLDSYEYGQLFYVSTLDRYYIYDENDGLKTFGNMGLNGVPFYVTLLPSVVIKIFFDKNYDRPFITNVDSSYLFSIKTLANTNKEITAIRLSDMHYFVATLTEEEYETYTIAQLLSSANEYEFASEDYVNAKVQEKITLSGTGGILSTANLNILLNNESAFIELGGSIYTLYRKTYSGGNLTSLSYWTNIAPNISSNVLHHNIESILVNISTRNWQLIRITRNAATPTYVDNAIQEFLQNEYTKVNTTTYPTLNSFLATTGEEGYIYLYPIDTSDESKGYYQYIWENNAWVSLGSTNIDLSGYVEKTTSANKVYGTNELGGQTTYTVDDFYEGNIARRDTDGSITVPLTPTQNGHASSKKYVDDLTTLKTLNGVDLHGTGNIAYDNELDSVSTNAVQNKVLNAELTITKDELAQLKAIVYETTIEEDSFTEEHLQESALPLSVNVKPIVFSAGMDSTNIKGRSFVYNQLVDTNTSEVATISGHKYLTYLSGSFALLTSTGTSISVVGGTDMVFDLTQSGIDSATTVDEAIALLQQNGINPYEYNEYSTGKIIDSKPTAVISHGFNIWDEEWEQGYINPNGVPASAQRLRSKNFIKVFPNTTYYLFCGTNCTFNLFFYDDNGVFISSIAIQRNNTITIPSNATKLKFFLDASYGDGTTYNNDICINLSNATLNGTYKPYIAPITYPLSLPILRSAGSVKDYQEQNGNINRLVGSANTNDITFRYTTAYSLTATLANCKRIITGTPIAIFDLNYQLVAADALGGVGVGWTIYDGNLLIRNVNLTEAQLREVIAGKHINYELATETTEQDTPLPENIEIEKGGSIEVTYDSTATTPSDFDFQVATYKPMEE